MLDSDVQNADAHLHVEFYESRAKGYEGFTFVRIMNPGDKTNIFDQPADETHQLRFPRHWLHFQMRREGLDVGPVGTALELWHADQPELFGENQMLELQMLKFHTVEQIAMASDAQLQRIGMGAAGLRDRARAYLSVKNQSEASAELAETRSQLAAMQQQMSALMEMVAAQNRAPAEAVVITPAAAPTTRRKAVPDGQLDADAGHAGNG